ncbi:hypothetical protein PCORN_15066 [Listeria cornellensis FSL F6-0969]|uniref:Uncharacterized protein n=1 Tax=Listeria cornellensis FSL F6-0969 TaxID=1265820 RepID=W7BSS6_9LIST|nr:hypothetical protein PCORN_15066 [Listeria cornellensis FSL F6-0969]
MEFAQHVVDLFFGDDGRVVFVPDVMREFGNMLAVFFGLSDFDMHGKTPFLKDSIIVAYWGFNGKWGGLER